MAQGSPNYVSKLVGSIDDLVRPDHAYIQHRYLRLKVYCIAIKTILSTCPRESRKSHSAMAIVQLTTWADHNRQAERVRNSILAAEKEQKEPRR